MIFSKKSLTKAGLASALFLGVLMLSGCPGFQSSDEPIMNNLVCDDAGCSLCEGLNCEPYYCDTVSQCPSGYVCTVGQRCMPTSSSAAGTQSNAPTSNSDGGIKQPTGCTSDAQCDTGKSCLEGICGVQSFPLRPEGTCQFNLDCGQLGTCLNSACYFPPVEGLCPQGSALENGLCLPNSTGECSLNSQCPAHSLCIDATCRSACSDDKECSRGTFCGGVGLCELDTRPSLQCLNSQNCGTSESCVDGRCLNACGENAACESAANSCDFGFCMPTAECFEAHDCQGQKQCINGLCSAF
jgi:hypothetical protein